MARKKHLINVHTSTGTTAPTGASLYLGEIAVQHTPNDPALWIKVGSAETSTEYEKFIGKTEITNLINQCNILGSGYTYSGIPYVNSSTTIADAYSALTFELIEDEYTTASALNDLNDRVNELSGSTGVIDELVSAITENEETTAAALNSLNNEVLRLMTNMRGDSIYLTNYDKDLVSGETVEDFEIAEGDSVNEGFAKLENRLGDDEEVTAAALNDLNSRLLDAEEAIEILSGDTGASENLLLLSASVITLSAASVSNEYIVAMALNDLNDRISEILDTPMILGSGYTYSGLPFINSSTTIADACSALTKVVIDDEYVTSNALNNLNDRLTSAEEMIEILSGETGSSEAIERLQSAITETDYVLSQAINDLNARVDEVSANTTLLTLISGLTNDMFSAKADIAYLSGKTNTFETNISVISGDMSSLSAKLVTDEYVISRAFNDVNSKILILSANSISQDVLDELSDNIDAVSGAVQTLGTNVNSVSGAVQGIQNSMVTAVTSASTNSEYPTAKAVYDEVHPAIITTGGTSATITVEPNVLYNFGTLTGTKTFALATPGDSSVVNHYYWTFDTSTTAPTITWPTGLTWYGGSEPTVAANSHYEVSVLNGIAVSMEI